MRKLYETVDNKVIVELTADEWALLGSVNGKLESVRTRPQDHKYPDEMPLPKAIALARKDVKNLVFHIPFQRMLDDSVSLGAFRNMLRKEQEIGGLGRATRKKLKRLWLTPPPE